MKLSFSKDHGTIKVSVDAANHEEDMLKCRKLEKLYGSEEWIVFLELMAQVESLFDEAIMRVKPSEISARECQVYAARKSGFCEAMKLLGRAVAAHKEYKKEQNEIIEAQVDEILGRKNEANFAG